MPRPGPRPYECVRRAWHTDKHQPLRGSLIQEIFRVTHEIHSPVIKKNKEWQEKLPIVVLKAEEIMYSKANSEAEYMDPKTLWDRLNDAVNTIISRDGSSENGDLLQPCIEAALSLGCYPRRASRSQRYSNSSCYLGHGRDNLRRNYEGKPTMDSALFPCCPNVLRPAPSSSKCLENELSCITSKFSMYNKLHPPTNARRSHHAVIPPAKSHSSYPLYHGTYPKSTENKTEPECDLSLRLGPIPTPCTGLKRKCPLDAQDVGLISSRGRTKFTVGASSRSHFCGEGNATNPLDSCLIGQAANTLTENMLGGL
ncbi:hypothetical protein Droror1_Dr00017529 [Drosera rotundifolia]